ncbi:MAG TPA: D-alanyl-D-alanine carboxypeptidase family protein [Acidimicrobiia bacterium]
MRRSKTILLAVAALSGLVLPASAAPLTYPVQIDDPWPVPNAPHPTAPSWLVYDANADAILASRNSNDERAIASVTKIMTGLVVMEYGHPDELVTVSEKAAATGEKEIELEAGEQVTVEQLFKALMIHSANDAATALAEHIGGSVDGFVGLMNARVAELGLEHTNFANPHGLDAANHYSSARDLVVLAREAMAYPEFAEAVRSRSYVFPPAPDGTARIAQTTNLMLGEYEGMAGIKTGFTFQALLTFVAAAERDGRMIYVVVLGSEGRRQHFADAELLFDYAFDDMPYYQMLSSGQPYDSPQPRVAPGPRTVARDSEAMLHLAGEGLLLEQPGPIGGEPIPEPSPVVETTRSPEAGPDSFWSAVTFWFSAGE